MDRRIPSWLPETLKIWAQYLAVGFTAILPGYMYATDVVTYHSGWVGHILNAIFAAIFAGVSWVTVGILFEIYTIAREAWDVHETVATVHEQILQEQQEVNHLKAETRSMIEAMRAAA